MEPYDLQQIMNEHGDYLVRVSYVYVKSWSTAEEIVQDVFVKFYETHEKFEQRASMKTYLAKMTINRSCDHLRSVKGRLRILGQLWKTSETQGNSSEDETLKKLEQNAIAKAVFELALKYREVIVLYYYEELTSAEIAKLLDLPEGTVKTRLRRGRDNLKTQLKVENSEVNLFE